MKPLGSFVLRPVLTDVASFMDAPDVIQLSLASPRANQILTGHPTLARDFDEISVSERSLYCSSNKISWCTPLHYSTTPDSTQDSSGTLPLNDDIEAAHKQIIVFLKTVRKARKIRWSDYDIDDAVIKEIYRIELLEDFWVSGSRVTASLGSLKRLVVKKPYKVHLSRSYAPASLIWDEVLPLLKDYTDITSLSSIGGPDDFVSTNITDRLLECPRFKTIEKKSFDDHIFEDLSLRYFFNLKLSFPAILKLFKDVTSVEGRASWNIHYLGIIGCQEMPAVLEYCESYQYHSWNFSLCSLNNNCYMEFHDIFSERDISSAGYHPTFGVSFDRNQCGVVGKTTVPELFVDAESLSSFTAFVQVMNSNGPIEAVLSSSIKIDYLSVVYKKQFGHAIMDIIVHMVKLSTAKNEDDHHVKIRRTNLDQSSAENIIVNLLKMCRWVGSLDLEVLNYRRHESMFALTDRMFGLLMEHTRGTEIRDEWTMNIQLSEANLARLRQNQATGLFKMLLLNEDIISESIDLSDENYAKFDKIFDRYPSEVVEHASIPEENVDATAYKSFKAIAQAVKSEISIDEVLSAKIELAYLQVSYRKPYDSKILKIHAGIMIQNTNIGNQKYHPIRIIRTNMNESTIVDIIVKLFRMCSSIGCLKMEKEHYDESMVLFSMDNKMYDLLMKYAKDIEIMNRWTMSLRVSHDIQTRILDNRTTGLFKMFKSHNFIADKMDIADMMSKRNEQGNDEANDI